MMSLKQFPLEGQGLGVCSDPQDLECVKCEELCVCVRLVFGLGIVDIIRVQPCMGL